MTENAIKLMCDAIEHGLKISREHIEEARELISKGNEAGHKDAVSAAERALENGFLGEAEYLKAKDALASIKEKVSENDAKDIQGHCKKGFEYLGECELYLRNASEALGI